MRTMSQYEGLTQGSFKNSTARRLPICFCLDVSGSMIAKTTRGTKRIDEMNAAFNRFLEAMKGNEVVAESADVAALTFGGKVDVPLQMTPISQVETQTFDVRKRSFTPLGEAILTAIQLLDLRKQGYKDNGMKYFQPWLVVITDGEPEGDGAAEAMDEAVQMINQLESEGKIVIFPVGIGTDVDFRELKRISRIRKEPIRVDETNLSAFFDFLNASSEQVVTGSLETEELNRTINRQYEPEETPSDDDGYHQEINLDDWSI